MDRTPDMNPPTSMETTNIESSDLESRLISIPLTEIPTIKKDITDDENGSLLSNCDISVTENPTHETQTENSDSDYVHPNITPISKVDPIAPNNDKKDSVQDTLDNKAIRKVCDSASLTNEPDTSEEKNDCDPISDATEKHFADIEGTQHEPDGKYFFLFSVV